MDQIGVYRMNIGKPQVRRSLFELVDFVLQNFEQIRSGQCLKRVLFVVVILDLVDAKANLEGRVLLHLGVSHGEKTPGEHKVVQGVPLVRVEFQHFCQEFNQSWTRTGKLLAEIKALSSIIELLAVLTSSFI